MTAEQPRYGAGQPADEPKLCDGLTGVFRARWSKSAGRREPRRDHQLINRYSFEGDSTGKRIHDSPPRRLINSVRSSSNFLSPAERRGLMTTSNPAGSSRRAV